MSSLIFVINSIQTNEVSESYPLPRDLRSKSRPKYQHGERLLFNTNCHTFQVLTSVCLASKRIIWDWYLKTEVIRLAYRQNEIDIEYDYCPAELARPQIIQALKECEPFVFNQDNSK